MGDDVNRLIASELLFLASQGAADRPKLLSRGFSDWDFDTERDIKKYSTDLFPRSLAWWFVMMNHNLSSDYVICEDYVRTIWHDLSMIHNMMFNVLFFLITSWYPPPQAWLEAAVHLLQRWWRTEMVYDQKRMINRCIVQCFIKLTFKPGLLAKAC